MYLYKNFNIEIEPYSDAEMFSFVITKEVRGVSFFVAHIVDSTSEHEEHTLLKACMYIDHSGALLISAFRKDYAVFCSKVEVKPQYYFERGYDVDYFLRSVKMIKESAGRWITNPVHFD